MTIEGVTYYKFRVTFRLADGSRRRWVRWSPGWNWVYGEVARELWSVFGDTGVKPHSCKVSAL